MKHFKIGDEVRIKGDDYLYCKVLDPGYNNSTKDIKVVTSTSRNYDFGIIRHYHKSVLCLLKEEDVV